MSGGVDYDWNLRLRLAEKGIYKAAELAPHLAEHGIRLSDSQIWRLITGRPERLNLQVLAVLCELLDCTPNDLITVRQLANSPALEKAAAGDRTITGLTPAKARIRQTPHDRRT
jgi:DNA-binding Xre family transcriptional regulator